MHKPLSSNYYTCRRPAKVTGENGLTIADFDLLVQARAPGECRAFVPAMEGTAKTDSPLEESLIEPSVPRCAYTADSAAVVWRRLIRAVSGGSSDRRSTTRSVWRGQQLPA